MKCLLGSPERHRHFWFLLGIDPSAVGGGGDPFRVATRVHPVRHRRERGQASHQGRRIADMPSAAVLVTHRAPLWQRFHFFIDLLFSCWLWLGGAFLLAVFGTKENMNSWECRPASTSTLCLIWFWSAASQPMGNHRTFGHHDLATALADILYFPICLGFLLVEFLYIFFLTCMCFYWIYDGTVEKYVFSAGQSATEW